METIDAEVTEQAAIAKRDPLNNQLQRQTTTPADLLQIAVEGGADIDKLEKLMELQMRWDASEARKAYTRAMAQFRAGCPEILKNRTVNYGQTHYTHADLSGAIGQIKGVLTECGLSHSWRTENLPTGIQVTCILTHVDGHSEQTAMVCQPDNTGSKNPIQAMGSAVTYLQRYTLFAILGLASADDDDAGKMTEPQKPLQRANQAKQARNNPTAPDQQPQGEPEAPATPPARKPDPDAEAKRQFAVVCDTVAMDFNIIKAAEHLSAREYKGLLAQCQQMSGSDTIAEATQWAIANAKGMVKDEVGTRFIA